MAGAVSALAISWRQCKQPFDNHTINA